MTPEYRIAALWVEGALSWLEQLCLVSFRDAGHHVTLYHYGPLENVPDGIELADAAAILPREGFLRHGRTGSPALHSDLFRYHLLAGSDRTIWADTDAYCLRPFATETGHFFGWESEKHINGGVLGLPRDSEALGRLLEFTADEYAIPPWLPPEERARLEAAREAGRPVHAGEMAWGVWGPHALTHFLHETDEARHALPRAALYPFPFRDRRKMLKPGLDTSPWITPETLSIHFYGRRMRRRLVEKEGGVPHPDSLIGRLIRRHGIDVAAAPLSGAPADEGTPTEARSSRPASPKISSAGTRRTAPPVVGLAKPAERTPVAGPRQPEAPLPRMPARWRTLTDLADALGSDKGARKHRYTELYEMLFRPLRRRKLRLVEMGLLIGGPEHGRPPSRETHDLPSVRMWLEYFPRAEILGLDISDFSWFEHPRFRFLRCDMGDRAALRRAAEEIDSADIIIDDASHASHHQQLALVELFPRLASGGLYIIEDLRWQPPEMELPDWPKTAALFRAFQRTGRFEHPDRAVEEGLNAIAEAFQGVFLFPAHYRRKRRDQLLVIHKL